MNFTPKMTAVELDELCRQTIEQINANIIAYDVRAAIQAEALDDGKTTTQRAIEALQRPERFRGEHNVARAWLRKYS